MIGLVLSFAWGFGVDDGLVVGVSCAGRSVTDASSVSSYFHIIVGVVVGRDVFLEALCLVDYIIF